MLTAKEGTRFYRALQYIKPAIGRADYRWWTSGIVPDGAPAYAVNAPPPPIETVIRNGLFCAALPNLMLRVVGKRIPTRGNALYDGGIAAYWHTSAWGLGDGYFAGYERRFHLPTAKRWARESRSGVLIGRSYRNVSDQGHVGILLPSGYVLQSDAAQGLHWNNTIEVDHWGYYYEWMVPSGDWINYEGDEV